MSQLYRVDGVAVVGERCGLAGIVCACGHPAFPPQRLGCERCGLHGDGLAETVFSGDGTLLAQVEVHVHAGARSVPFRIATIRLDEGPEIRALIEDDGRAAAGTPVSAWLFATEGGFEPRFVAEREGQGA